MAAAVAQLLFEIIRGIVGMDAASSIYQKFRIGVACKAH